MKSLRILYIVQIAVGFLTIGYSVYKLIRMNSDLSAICAKYEGERNQNDTEEED